jgi:hypothetical protein
MPANPVRLQDIGKHARHANTTISRPTTREALAKNIQRKSKVHATIWWAGTTYYDAVHEIDTSKAHAATTTKT